MNRLQFDHMTRRGTNMVVGRPSTVFLLRTFPLPFGEISLPNALHITPKSLLTHWSLLSHKVGNNVAEV